MKIVRPSVVDKASMVYGIKLAASVAADYDKYSSHPYLVSECILGKLNALPGKPKKNKHVLDRITAMERRVDSAEATTRFLVKAFRRKAPVRKSRR